MININKLLTIFSVLVFSLSSVAQNTITNSTIYSSDKFKQLKEELPGPNMYRSASGAPGPEYFQQQADYVIEVVLDDEKQKITGKETITYHNNSKDELTYLWIQLDQNMRAEDSDTKKINQSSMGKNGLSFGQMKKMHNNFEGGFNLTLVQTSNGKDLHYFINKTMMRVDLPTPLAPGSKMSFNIEWWYNINDRMEIGGRSGFEFFEEDSNYLYTIAQFYPRMAVYNEVEGWQNKQFLGGGEFALTFGNYKVSITAPEDHIIGATGSLQNASSVLTSAQRKRLVTAKKSDTPVMIVNQNEAESAEKTRKSKTKTWTFYAENVRDFAFASSRKFIWDAMGVKVGDKTVMAMSYYPKEGNPLWEQYSTRIVAHTIATYSKYTIDYTYPVAISVHSKWIGMEYPMICFNGGRPEKDGTYSESTKHGMQSVIIHEVGHNFFPMIINSDERQWTWMDEGLNTFVQYLTEQEWDKNYPSRRGPAQHIVPYMSSDPASMVPIMTNSESILQFGNNAYAKTATSLNILRETIMGRELFDYAFKTYAERWAFKHPTPADFFRTMEDASAVDLDWFWRGWYYTIDNVDISLTDVKWYKVNTQNPEVEAKRKKYEDNMRIEDIGTLRHKDEPATVVDQDETMKDFYDKSNPYSFDILDVKKYESYMKKLTLEEKAFLDTNLNYYELKFDLVGGLVMPIIVEFEFADGSKQVERIPAEIWRKSNTTATKLYWFDKTLVRVVLDPYLETADINRGNNYWPHQTQPSRFDIYQSKRKNKRQAIGENPMQKAKRAKEAESK
ncbi:MAG: M1 family metallopeptidase [Salibacteraceae bacterium]